MATTSSQKGCRCGLAALGLALVGFVALMAATVFFISRFTPSLESLPAAAGLPVNIAAVPGDGSHFDPIAAYDAVHKFAGDTLDLASITITYVRSDGTLDLMAPYDPNVDYRFMRELLTPPPNSPPVGVKGVTDQKWDNQVEVLIQPSRMISVGGDVQGLIRAAAPTCSLTTLWSTAIEKGAAKDAVATVRYDHNGYNFRIKNTSTDLNFDTDCHLKR
jgi:hypothetical protein